MKAEAKRGNPRRQKKQRRPRSQGHDRSLLAVVARDGDLCWLCKLPVNLALTSQSHPLRPTLDHKIPKSHGGDNSVRNLKLAHSRCNYRRGNRLGRNVNRVVFGAPSTHPEPTR